MRRRVVAGVVGLSCLVACTPGGAETPSPTPSVPSMSSSPSVTPSPTPTSERDRAIEAAAQGFSEFLRQTDLVAQDGGADELPDALSRLTTGSQTRQSLRDARDIKSARLRSKGFGKFVNAKATSVKNLSGAMPSVVLTGCIDQSGVSVTKAGKKYSGKPDYVRVTEARMERRSGLWQVSIWGGEVVPKGFTCENFS